MSMMRALFANASKVPCCRMLCGASSSAGSGVALVGYDLMLETLTLTLRMRNARRRRRLSRTSLSGDDRCRSTCTLIWSCWRAATSSAPCCWRCPRWRRRRSTPRPAASGLYPSISAGCWTTMSARPSLVRSSKAFLYTKVRHLRGVTGLDGRQKQQHHLVSCCVVLHESAQPKPDTVLLVNKLPCGSAPYSFPRQPVHTGGRRGCHPVPDRFRASLRGCSALLLATIHLFRRAPCGITYTAPTGSVGGTLPPCDFGVAGHD